jgi:NAD(P)-dependent dehydrogenase (short-subunit alcohol dehydrogenase family)
MTDPRLFRAPPDLLAGRVVLVTGASRGIGRAAALAFAGAGATVVLLGRDEQRLAAVYDEIEISGGPVPAAITFDLEQGGERDLDTIPAAIEQGLGRLDGIVHSATMTPKLAPVDAVDYRTWERLLRVNFLAPLALTRACLHLLKRSPDASVIYTSESHVAHPRAYWAPVAAPKAALVAAMQAQADEWSQWPHLRCNAVVPGPVASPARAYTHPGESPATLPAIDTILPVYLYLVGPASRGVSGTVFPCQG